MFKNCHKQLTQTNNFEDNIVLQIIDNRLNEIFEIISNNPQITRQYVEEIIEPVEESLNQLHNKVDQLLSKDKKHREILPFRDPINNDLFPIFIANAGSKAVRQKDLKQAQLRLAYNLLYFKGLRINEIRMVTEKQILDAISSAQFNAIHYKNRQAHSHVLSNTAIKSLKQLVMERTIIFQKYGYKYLFGKHEPIHQKSLIRLINIDLNNTCKNLDIPYIQY